MITEIIAGACFAANRLMCSRTYESFGKIRAATRLQLEGSRLHLSSYDVHDASSRMSSTALCVFEGGEKECTRSRIVQREPKYYNTYLPSLAALIEMLTFTSIDLHCTWECAPNSNTVVREI